MARAGSARRSPSGSPPEGAEVWVGDIDLEGAEKVAAEINGHAIELDVTDLDSAEAAVGEVGTSRSWSTTPASTSSASSRRRPRSSGSGSSTINLNGVFNCTAAALPGMQQAGYGRIVSISSEAGRVGSKGSAVYSAAKGGVIGFTKVIARENGRYGITANSIAPGPIETPLLMGAKEFGEIGEKIIENMRGLPSCGGSAAPTRSPPRSPSSPPMMPRS